jgi:hypothetical protein
MTLRIPHLLPAVALALAVGSCGATEPYIYKHDEFNRSAEDFNKPLTDRNGVTICYNGIGTTDAEVARIAGNECARFGKFARFQEATFGDCPMLTPVQARFACELPAGSAGEPEAGPESSDKG